MHSRITITAIFCFVAVGCSVEWIIPPDYFVECADGSDCPDTAECVATDEGTSSVCVTDGQPDCGNGVQEVGETCDHGPQNAGGYHLNQTCLGDCSGYGTWCGDGFINGEEVCDNPDPDSGCTDKCQKSDEVRCGDFVTHASFEQCDEGNEITEECDYGVQNCTICDANCMVQNLVGTWCGDGEIQQQGLSGASFEGCDGEMECIDMGLGNGTADCDSDCMAYNTTQECDVQDMVYVPEGPFLMGCNGIVDFDCSSQELPQHEVWLEAFLIDRFEVTAGQYAECVAAKGCVYAGSTTSNYRTYGREGRENYPINYVGWTEAAAYCTWKQKELPTEAQWEKAARGPDARKYPWGNLPEVGCNYASTQLDVPDEETCDDGGIMAVGSKPLGQTMYGAEDMIGNVWEWARDYYDEAYYQQAPQGEWHDPTGPAESNKRALRGGGWNNSASYYFRTSTRNGEEPDSRVGTYGFRCAKNSP